MERVLIVEDSLTLSRGLSRLVSAQLGMEPVPALSLRAACQLLDQADPPFLAALVDLHLPDAQGMEVLDAIAPFGVPTIVLTATFDDLTRREAIKRQVVEYLVKDSPAVADFVVRLLTRLDRNRRQRVLVVDDSRLVRHALRTLLERQNLRVTEASCGQEALALLEQAPDIRVMLTDFNMPGMSGDQLTHRIRQRRKRQDLAIIGISAGDSEELTSRFLKSGANDFLTKPFSDEEFNLRLMQNLEYLEHIAELRDTAARDHLTSLYNRRYFFERAPALLRQTPVAVAMLDIDHFKRVNDTWGHGAGDEVLRQVSRLILAHLGDTGMVARFGGEEFCALLPRTGAAEALERMDHLRLFIEQTAIVYGDEDLHITLSIGIAAGEEETLDQLLRASDEALYAAKEGGRNRVVDRAPAHAEAWHVREVPR